MNIDIKIIPHEQHRYPTVGDWQFDAAGDLHIQVSKMSDPAYESLVALHETVEAILCRDRGVTTEQVDTFDKQFEKERENGLHTETDEPGDDPRAPYKREHFFATSVERLMAAEMGVDWKTYEEEIYSLP